MKKTLIGRRFFKNRGRAVGRELVITSEPTHSSIDTWFVWVEYTTGIYLKRKVWNIEDLPDPIAAEAFDIVSQRARRRRSPNESAH